MNANYKPRVNTAYFPGMSLKEAKAWDLRVQAGTYQLAATGKNVEES